MARWPPPVYRSHTIFRAPLAYVFRWCTDYRPTDSRLIGERFERRILVRTHRRVLFEDLWWEADGWRWRRSDVALQPPDHWVAESLGNVRDAHLDYRLTALSADRTRLDLTMRRRPSTRLPRQPAKPELERELNEMWRHFATSLELEYRKPHPPKHPKKVSTHWRR